MTNQFLRVRRRIPEHVSACFHLLKNRCCFVVFPCWSVRESITSRTLFFFLRVLEVAIGSACGFWFVFVGPRRCRRGRGVSCRQGGRPAWPTPGTGTGSSVAFRRAKCRRRAGVRMGDGCVVVVLELVAFSGGFQGTPKVFYCPLVGFKVGIHDCWMCVVCFLWPGGEHANGRVHGVGLGMNGILRRWLFLVGFKGHQRKAYIFMSLWGGRGAVLQKVGRRGLGFHGVGICKTSHDLCGIFQFGWCGPPFLSILASDKLLE